MSNWYRFKSFAATLILLSLFSCAGFEHVISSIGDAFRGNTRKTIADFDLEDKKEYRNYYYQKHKQQREESKEIIYWMNKSESASNKQKPAPTSKQTNSPALKSKNQRNVFQKLLKVRQP